MSDLSLKIDGEKTKDRVTQAQRINEEIRKAHISLEELEYGSLQETSRCLQKIQAGATINEDIVADVFIPEMALIQEAIMSDKVKHTTAHRSTETS